MGLFLRRGSAPKRLSVSGVFPPVNYCYVMINGEKLTEELSKLITETTIVTIYVSATESTAANVKITLNGIVVAQGTDSTFSFVVEKTTTVVTKKNTASGGYIYYTCEIETMGG